MQQSVTDRLKVLIFERLDFVEPKGFDESTPLFDGGLGMDSFAAVELISLIESEFGIQFAVTDLAAVHFRDIGALGRLVGRYVSEP